MDKEIFDPVTTNGFGCAAFRIGFLESQINKMGTVFSSKSSLYSVPVGKAM